MLLFLTAIFFLYEEQFRQGKMKCLSKTDNSVVEEVCIMSRNPI